MNKLNVELMTIKNDTEDKVLAVFAGDYFTTCLEAEKCYEPFFTKFAHMVIKPNDIAIDLGANLGYHTLTMAELVGNNGYVLSFDPQRVIYQQLNCNVFLNKYGNVMTYQLAVGEDFSDIYIDTPNYYHISK
jgi:hypothetical protein